jgi:hypothetical protein
MNAPDRNPAAYTPRENSKVTAALQALADGPMTASALANLMTCAPNNVGARLRQAIESDMVVRLQDNTGLLHYALSEPATVEGFSRYHGAVDGSPAPRRPLNPADPFGLVANKAGPDAFSRRESPPAKARDKSASPLAVAHTPSAALRPHFDAAMHLSGELSITVGETTVWLDREHQLQLSVFTSKFGARS